MRDVTFTQELRKFLRSVDYLDHYLFDDIQRALRVFFQAIGAKFYEVQIDGYWVKRQGNEEAVPALCTILTVPGGRTVHTPIKDETGNFSGQTTYAYSTGKQLWIVGENGGPLPQEKDQCIDLWSNSANLPPYWDFWNDEVRTSIVLPLRSQERVYGFLNLEFVEYLEKNQALQRELEALADALSILFKLREYSQETITNSKGIFSEIEKHLPRTRESLLRKPRLFFAYPGVACEQALGIITQTIDEITKDFAIEVVDWRKMNAPGNISLQILKELASCQYGVCYFSELVQGSKPQQYKLNSNVIFEAGMLQSLTNDPATNPIGWLPIREEQPEFPFDFAQERTVIVPRLRSGDVNENKFNNDLKTALRVLLAYGGTTG